MKKVLAILVVVCFGLSIGCSKKSGDPMDDLMGHMAAMFKMLDAKDCAKSASELKSYVEKNKSDLEGLATRLKEMEKSMSDEDKKKYEEKHKAKFEKFMKEQMGGMMEFGMKCQKEMEEVSKAMAFMEKIK